MTLDLQRISVLKREREQRIRRVLIRDQSHDLPPRMEPVSKLVLCGRTVLYVRRNACECVACQGSFVADDKQMQLSGVEHRVYQNS
jgi:hypothetical protein